MNKHLEILSPAGSLEKLQFAIKYGADAVYAAGKSFGLRAKSTNLSNAELKEAVEYCHKHNAKLYITVNIFAHNEDIDALAEYLDFLQSIEVDALIISDPAVFSLAKQYAPNIDIHISTQANITSWRSVKFWSDLGASRVILARELTISEIKEIRAKVPEVELEMFVHGAMCMSYSGRCLLSSFLNGRDANRGNCTQPCRWGYNLIEKTRPNELFPIEEDDYGTYILNSKDLCLFDRLQEIIDAGVVSLKIEGRMKSLYYVAVVTRAYKTAIQLLQANKPVAEYLRAELDKVSHRNYTDGFFDSFDSMSTQYHQTSSYIREYQFIGEIIEHEPKVIISIRAKFSLGDEIEFIFPDSQHDFSHKVFEILDMEGKQLEFTKPNTFIEMRLDKSIPVGGIVRMKKN
ncbi:MAG: U32 family peptidase [Candidatus Cloacimonetes bacterium]|nr:U32 family peptidase [Candidatus Cloacimonadota bacterium]